MWSSSSHETWACNVPPAYTSNCSLCWVADSRRSIAVDATLICTSGCLKPIN